MSSEKFCPEKPIDNCPEGFICQQLEPVKGKELKDKMAQLEEEYKRKWTVESVKVSMGTKIYTASKAGAKKVSKIVLSGLKKLEKKIGETKIGSKMSKSKAFDLINRFNEKVKNYHFVQPMDKDHKSNLVNTEKKTVSLKYKAMNIEYNKEVEKRL